MAGVLIATAITGGTITAGMVGGAIVATGGAVKSFAEANKAKKKEIIAKQEGDKFMADARKKLEVNFAKDLSIQKEPYELAREATLVAGTQGLQAGVEGEERGSAATAGRVVMAQNDAQSKIRDAMGQEMSAIERAIIAEERSLRDARASLDLEEAAGAALAERDAAEDRAAFTEQGINAIGAGVVKGLEAMPLYGTGSGDAVNPRRTEDNPDMLTRRQRRDFLEAEAMYDAGFDVPNRQQRRFANQYERDIELARRRRNRQQYFDEGGSMFGSIFRNFGGEGAIRRSPGVTRAHAAMGVT